MVRAALTNHRHVGVAYLAAMHKDFPARKAISVFNSVEHPILGVLWGTFGTSKRAMKGYLNICSDRPHILHIYLLNQVCVRHGNCKRGEIMRALNVKGWNSRIVKRSSRLVRLIQKRIRIIKNFIEQNGNCNTIPSLVLALEDNFDNQSSSELRKIVSEVWPYAVVRNPVGVKNFNHSRVECHGVDTNVGSGFGSMDGVDIEFPHRLPTIAQSAGKQQILSWAHRNQSASGLMLWSAKHQGIFKNTTSVPAPRQRIIDVSGLDVAYMEQLLLEIQK